MQHVGTDYNNLEEVRQYDERMALIRDVDEENCQILAKLDLSESSSVIEIGCGTGRFALMAAGQKHDVLAVDISKIMLEYVGKRAADLNVASLQTQHAGFLSLEAAPESVDAVVTCAALHHLPDIWKLVALRKIWKMLKPEGVFFLKDAVFDISPEHFARDYEKMLADLPENFRPPVVRHFRQEYSTTGWIMEGLLRQTGFQIIENIRESDIFCTYLCRKLNS